MYNLNLFYLKCFLDAVLMGSISESARRNFVSQSAVSQAIKKLSATLNTPLCSHKKQKFEPTAEGKIVFEQAEEIFSAVRDLHDALAQHKKHPSTPLYFVTTHSIGLSLLPHHLAEYRHTHPQLDVQFQLGGIAQIKGWLKQGLAEFALVLDSSHFIDYQKMPLHEGHFHLYRHRDESTPLSRAGIYVEHHKGLMVPEFKKAYLIKHKQHVPISGELNSWELIARTIENHKGYGLIPDFIMTQQRHPSLIATDEPAPRYQLCAIFHKGKQLSYSARCFLEPLG